MMKRIISILLSLFLVIFAAVNFSVVGGAQSTFSLDDCGELLDVFSDRNGGFYLLFNHNDVYNVIKIDATSAVTSAEIDVSVSESIYAYSLGKLYFIENSSNYENNAVRNYLTVTSYDCLNGFIKRSVINDAKVLLDGTFAVDYQGNYYISSDIGINVYTNRAILKSSLDLKSRQHNMTSSPDGSIVYSTNGEKLTIICGEDSVVYDIRTDKIFVSENSFLSTSDGTVYRYDGISLSEACTFDYSNGFGSIGEYLVGRKGDKLCAIQGSDEINLNIAVNDSSYIISSGDVCGCFIEDGGSLNAEFICYEEIEDFKKGEQAPPNNEDSDEKEFFIKSDVYFFDDRKMIITGVQPQTTIAVIKKNIDLQGYSFIFKDHNSNNKSSGVIGTGASICFSGSNSKVYQLIIFGDVSGEGNINSRDKSILANHLLKKERISGVNVSSADVNGDGVCDLKDLVAIEKHINGQYYIEQKRYVN